MSILIRSPCGGFAGTGIGSSCVSTAAGPLRVKACCALEGLQHMYFHAMCNRSLERTDVRVYESN